VLKVLQPKVILHKDNAINQSKTDDAKTVMGVDSENMTVISDSVKCETVKAQARRLTRSNSAHTEL
jgi:hypothetical protein